MAFMIVEYKSRAALLQGEQRDSAVNINAYRVLQRHRAVSLMQQGFLVYISRPFKCWNYSRPRPIADFYGRDAKVTTITSISPKSRTAQDQNRGKSHGDREYRTWLSICRKIEEAEFMVIRRTPSASRIWSRSSKEFMDYLFCDLMLCLNSTIDVQEDIIWSCERIVLDWILCWSAGSWKSAGNHFTSRQDRPAS